MPKKTYDVMLKDSLTKGWDEIYKDLPSWQKTAYWVCICAGVLLILGVLVKAKYF